MLKTSGGIENPRIALLNNGIEATMGDELHKATYQLLADDPDLNFVGNVEANDLLKGVADVVVTDGFTGNATLKAIEWHCHNRHVTSETRDYGCWVKEKLVAYY